MERDNIPGVLFRSRFPEASPCVCLFPLHRRPEGGGNYLVACQRGAIIAPCTGRMSAVNMDAGAACAAVGDGTGAWMNLAGVCVSLNHLGALCSICEN